MGRMQPVVMAPKNPLFHPPRACPNPISYPDITGMYLAPDIKISGHIHGRPKCQISLKLPCFLIRVATTSNFLRCWTLPGTKYMATYGLLCRIQCAAACGRPVGSHMVTYGLFLYGETADLWGLIWSHTVSFSVSCPTAPAS